MNQVQEIQPVFRNFATNEFEAILESVLDEFPNQHYRIPKIEIDIGKVELHSLKHSLRSALTEKITNYILQNEAEIQVRTENPSETIFAKVTALF